MVAQSIQLQPSVSFTNPRKSAANAMAGILESAHTYQICVWFKELWHSRNQLLLIPFFTACNPGFFESKFGVYVIWNVRNSLQNLITDNFSKMLSRIYSDPYHAKCIVKTDRKNGIIISKRVKHKCLKTYCLAQRNVAQSLLILDCSFFLVCITGKGVKFGSFSRYSSNNQSQTAT